MPFTETSGHVPQEARYPLSTKEKSELTSERLQSKLSINAKAFNSDFKEKYGIDNLLNDECSIQKRFYGDKDKNKEFIDAIKRRQITFIGKKLAIRDHMDDDRSDLNEEEINFIQQAYQTKYKLTELPTLDQVLEYWEQEKNLEKNRQLEMAATVLLNRVFGKDFKVVGATDFDDIFNGTDLFFIDEKTGKIIFALDTVHTGPEYQSGSNSRLESKKQKQLHQLWNGGSDINFGLEITERKLLGAPIEHLPSFYFALNTEQLNGILDEYTNPDSEEISDLEKQLALTFFKSLFDQINAMKHPNIDNPSFKLDETLVKNLDAIHTRFREIFPAKTEETVA